MADLVEVELDDELEPLPERPRRPRGPWSVRRWAWAATGLAVVLATATVAGGIGAASAGMAVVGGLTTDLGAGRHALWTDQDARLLGAVGDLVLVSDEYGRGVRALSVTDGSEVWQADGECTLAPVAGTSAEQVLGGTVVRAHPQDARVVCTDATGRGEPGTRLLDPATGKVIAQAPQQLTVLGRYLADLGPISGGEGSGSAGTITVLSLVDGTELWTRDVDPSSGQQSWGYTPTALVVLDGTVVNQIDLATGRWSPVPDGALVPLFVLPAADGRTVTTGWRASGQLATAVADATGRELWSLDGYGAVPARVHDDGPGAFLALGPAGGTAALDPETGSVLWTAEPDSGFPLVQVSGVVLTGAASPSLRDERTGEVRWTVPDGEVALSASDGTTLLLRDGATGAFVVRDLRTGREVTRFALPEVRQGALVQDVVALPGGRLALVTTDGLALLAP